MGQPSLEDLLNSSFEELRLKTSSHTIWGIDRAQQWNFNQDTSILSFDLTGGVRAEAPGQIVGTYLPSESTWMWSWANESIKKKLVQDAEMVRQYGMTHGFLPLTTPESHMTEEWAWRLTALAVRLAARQGAYRGPAGETLVFFSFGEVKLHKA
jgi:hypothetical protein